MPEISFHTTYSDNQYLLARSKSGSQSGLQGRWCHRFGFNGQEMDNEISGLPGTHTTAEFWEYDSRLGRRWNVDPVVKDHESPYLCFGGNPVWSCDPAGDDDTIAFQVSSKTFDVFGDKIPWAKRTIKSIGRSILNFGEGFLNSLSSNLTLGFNRKNPYERNDLSHASQDSYFVGQKVGDVIGLVAGCVETLIGGGGEAAGVVLSPIGIGVPVMAFSFPIFIHGASVVVCSARNLFSSVEQTSDNAHGNPPQSKSNSRVTNPSKSKSKVWKNLEPYRDGIKKSGQGKDTQYYTWDHTHNDIEVWDRNGNHLGSMDPTTGRMYKPAVEGRILKNLK